MATSGKTIRNSVTGEDITWLKTAKDTGGEYLTFNFKVAPGGFLPVRHVHPNQDESFEISKGTFKLEMGGKTAILQVGEKVVIPRGVPHQWWNASTTDPVECLVRFEPALNTETFLEQFFGLCNNGKTKPDGSPAFLQIMAMVNEYDLFVAGPPVPVQKIMGNVLGGIGQVLGYKKFYSAYSQG